MHKKDVLFAFYFLVLFSSLLTLLIHRKASEVLDVREFSSDYPDLLSEMPRYLCPIETFYLFFFTLQI